MREKKPELGNLVEIETRRHLLLGGSVPEKSIGFVRSMVFPPEERALPSRMSLSGRNTIYRETHPGLPDHIMNYKGVISCSVLSYSENPITIEEALSLQEGSRVAIAYALPFTDNGNRFLLYPGYITGDLVLSRLEIARTKILPSQELMNCWAYPIKKEFSIFPLEENKS